MRLKKVVIGSVVSGVVVAAGFGVVAVANNGSSQSNSVQPSVDDGNTKKLPVIISEPESAIADPADAEIQSGEQSEQLTKGEPAATPTPVPESITVPMGKVNTEQTTPQQPVNPPLRGVSH